MGSFFMSMMTDALLSDSSYRHTECFGTSLNVVDPMQGAWQPAESSDHRHSGRPALKLD
ncbi:hypothetical protein KIN20_006589 [Parelaphostrongylus tenuis]|uniref:Uncharacterized protein n=1 Tax=Parelaphostrongylus tenuis TaxID=148309 RepID=A0AAD5MKK8_PARTN|nr:hypothetical protein KIN20_006589 [Parelaphostrongylus tenuis]